MQLTYQGRDITNAVEIRKADITDNAGGVADSLELWLNDTRGYWSLWQPQKNDIVQLRQNGFDSGRMYVDELEQQRGVFIVRALSIPQAAKTANTQGWESVRFLAMAAELAARHGFSLRTFDLQNHLYSRVDQVDQGDIAFLAGRAALEGYALKMTGGTAVVYDERSAESRQAARTIYKEQMDGEYRFKKTSTGIYSACRVTYGGIRAEFRAPDVNGPVLHIKNIPVSSHGEAERFARNVLRVHNKLQMSGFCTVPLDTGLAASNVVRVQGVGLGDGHMFCQQVVHKLVSKKTVMCLRRPLEGY